MLIVHIVIILIFIALGLFFMSKIMFAYAGCFAVVAASALFHSLIPLWIGLGLFLAVTVFTLIYANTGDRFKK